MRAISAEAAAHGGLFLFGIVVALLGAVLPLVSAPLGMGLGVAGNLFVVLNGAILAGSLAFGLIVDRFGYRGALTSGPLLIAVALVLVARAASVTMLGGAVAILGLGGSALNNATNALQADLYLEPKAKAAALNRLGVAFATGALLLPLLIGTLLDRLGLNPLLYATAGLAVLVALSSALPAYPRAKQPQGISLPEALTLLRHPLVAILSALFFFEAGTEMVVSGYLTTFLTLETGASVRAASGVLSGFWVAMLVARLVLGRVLLRVPAPGLIPVLAGVAAGALVLAAFAPGFACPPARARSSGSCSRCPSPAPWCCPG
jgi:FHS family glucose/mannose:H+ symporter-like MFS transporter